MSVHIFKENIGRFLSSKAPEIIAIKGPWGSGKTYTWNMLLTESKNKINLDHYSYISLFDIDSIKSIKQTIYEQTINKKN
jgi:Cdc6-like AAA superfamily ATPase